MPVPKRSPQPVPTPVFNAIQALDAALRNAYGADCAYTIVVHGHIAAASNAQHGRVLPACNGRQEP